MKSMRRGGKSPKLTSDTTHFVESEERKKPKERAVRRKQRRGRRGGKSWMVRVFWVKDSRELTGAPSSLSGPFLPAELNLNITGVKNGSSI